MVVKPGTSDPGKPAVVGTGPGSSFVSKPAAGSRLAIDDYAPITPIMIDGVNVVHDTGWSDAQEAEDRWGEGELGSPSWFYQWGVAISDLAAQPGNEAIKGTIDSTKKELQWLQEAAEWVKGVPVAPFRPEVYRADDYEFGEGNNPENPMIPR